MLHYDEKHYDENLGLSAPSSPALDDERLPDAAPAARAAADTDSELAELRRNLLLYGTAGEAARTRVAVRAS